MGISKASANAVTPATKGALAVGSGTNTASILSVGSNGDTLVADSSTTTGLRYNPPVGSLGNPVINGGMDIWQRGTSFSLTASSATTYTADRWVTKTGTNQACTISRQTTGDTTNLPNIQYCLRYQRNSGQTGTGSIYLLAPFETTNSIPFVGKTITLSFYARGGSNFSGTLSGYAVSGTGTDQQPFTDYTGSSTVLSTAASSLTTTWQRFTATGVVGSTANELYIGFNWTPSGTAGTNDYYEVTGVQIDVGTYIASTAPTFRRSGGTLAGELAACQRYCYRRTTGGNGYGMATITAFGSNDGYARIDLPVRMRTTPTATLSGTVSHYRAYINNLVNLTSIGLAEGNTDFVIFNVGVTGNGLYGVGAAGWLASDTSGNGYLQLNAEL